MRIGPAQLEQSRIRADDAQVLLGPKVDIYLDEILSARYTGKLGAQHHHPDQDRRKILEREQSDYEGGLGNPLSWEREVEKFNWLSEPFADANAYEMISSNWSPSSTNIRSRT